MYAFSHIVVSLVGGTIASVGKKREVRTLPSIPYADVSFIGESHDRTKLEGWYFNRPSEKAVILVHGWGGNRASLLSFAESLASHGTTVLSLNYAEDRVETLTGNESQKSLRQQSLDS